MEALSVRDYRNNLAASFDRAESGERVLIRRRNQLYALISVGEEEVSLSSAQQQRIYELSESIRRSLAEVKQIESGEIDAKSAKDFINEL
ncbi:MAG: YggN family protein [Muribaculaceae bacterium]|nr:YggN family protein [Muribaculaceae bacterium]